MAWSLRLLASPVSVYGGGEVMSIAKREEFWEACALVGILLASLTFLPFIIGMTWAGATIYGGQITIGIGMAVAFIAAAVVATYGWMRVLSYFSRRSVAARYGR